MATVQRFEGPSLDDVLAQVRLALGDDAEIIEANRIKASGVIGSDRYEVKARRAQKGQRRADRQAADAHVNPMSGAGTGRGETYPGGLDDATVQAAMDHVQQVMADLERKRIAQDHADTPSPTSLVDLADQVVDDSPAPALGAPNLGDDPSFAALLAEARANAKANAPQMPMEWPELDALASAEALAEDGREDGTVEWEPLDWSARRVRTADPEPMEAPAAVAFVEDAEPVEANAPAVVGAGLASAQDLDAHLDITVEDDDGSGDSHADVDPTDHNPADHDPTDHNPVDSDPLDDDPTAIDPADDDAVVDAHVEYVVEDAAVTAVSDDTEDLGYGRSDAELADGLPPTLEHDGDEVVAVEASEAATPTNQATILFGDDAPANPALEDGEDTVSETDADAAPVVGSELAVAADQAEPESSARPDADLPALDTAESAGAPGDASHHPMANDSAHSPSARDAFIEPDAGAAGDTDENVRDDELSGSPQTGWVDADREFMGVWTDEAEHEDAGWFATGEPDDEVQEFATLRNHRLVEWLSRNDLTPEALNQALEGLPRPDDLPPGPGVIIAVVGEGPLVLPLARRIAVDLDADPAKVVLASEHRSHASVPDNCRISNADEAALDRRAWRRRSSATLVAVDTSTSLATNAQDWACQVLESLQPHQVIALVDAGRKAEDVARWIADLGGIDAIALSGLEETVSPHAILELGIPVARLGTQVATPRAWSALLRNRREPVE